MRGQLQHSAYAPIAEYGFLSDCEAMALIAPSGNVEWLCLPRPDSPSVFGSLLDRGAGGFRLGPADVMVSTARRYLPGTMVLETSWGTSTGWIGRIRPRTRSDDGALWHSSRGGHQPGNRRHVRQRGASQLHAQLIRDQLLGDRDNVRRQASG
jgi:GH15 family glucan-1,4-alpha-glucosidase